MMNCLGISLLAVVKIQPVWPRVLPRPKQIGQVEVVPASSLDISFALPVERRRRCRLRQQLPAAPAGAAVARNGSSKVYKSVQEQPTWSNPGSIREPGRARSRWPPGWRGSFGRRTSVGVCGRKLRVQTAAARQRGCWDSRSRSSVGSGGRMRRRAVRFRDPTMSSDQSFEEDHT